MIYKQHSAVAAVCPAGHDANGGARLVSGVGQELGRDTVQFLEIASQEQTN